MTVQACDSAHAQSADAGEAPKHPRWLLTTCILASSLSFIDGSVVNVGLPQIGRSLQAGAADLQWIINAYLLPLSALLLLGGALGDRLGRRQVLILGIGLFAAASAICVWSPSLGWLLAGRALQGVGAALLLPNSLAILGSAFSGEAKGRAVGTWAAASSAAGALGPLVGGWLIDTAGWRSMFLINLPVAAGAIGLALVFVAKDKAEGRRALDLPGAGLATAALGAVTLGLTLGSGPSGWTPLAIAATASSVLLTASFLWVEKARGEKAMMPLSLFSTASFAGVSLLTLMLYGALGGLLVLFPYLLIEAAGYSGVQAGAALLPFSIIIAVASPIMGGLAGRVGSRWPLTIGPLVVAAGFALAMRIGPHSDYWTGFMPPMLVISLGMAIAVAPLTTAVLASVDAKHTGLASGFNSAVARTGGLLATALLGGVLAARGDQLFEGWRIAASVCAVACVASSLCAFSLIRETKTKRSPGPASKA